MLPQIIGIHFGIDSSVVAAITERGMKIIPNSEGQFTTPSIVARLSNGEWIAGLITKHQKVTNTEGTFNSFKVFLGRHFDDVEHFRRSVSYNVVKSANGECRIVHRGETYSIQDICSHLFLKLKRDASEYLGRDITHVAITEDPQTTPKQRNVVEDALNSAGLNLIGFISEPIAAVKEYLAKVPVTNAAVFDLSESAFTISILESIDGEVSVKLPRTDLELSETAFDKELSRWLTNMIKEKHNIDLTYDNISRARLENAISAIKEELLSYGVVTISLPKITENKDLKFSLSKSEVEVVFKRMMEYILDIADRCIFDADLLSNEISDVIFIGQRSQLTFLQDVLMRRWHREPKVVWNPDEAKAVGALLHAQEKASARKTSHEQEERYIKNLTEEEKLKHYLRILGIEGAITFEEIKRCYRAIVQQYHPDKVHSLGKELRDVAEWKTKEINEAYEYLKGRYSP